MDITKLVIDKSVWKYNDQSQFHVETIESGLHSDLYMNTDCIISDIKLVELIVKNIFVKELHEKNIKPDWIISYPPYGLVIAYELARQVDARFGYIDTKKEECNFDIQKNDTVIVLWDDIYSWWNIIKTINLLKTKGANIMSPIFTIWNFMNTEKILDLNIVSVISEKWHLYSEQDCPMCKSGSKVLSPRIHRNELKNNTAL